MLLLFRLFAEPDKFSSAFMHFPWLQKKKEKEKSRITINLALEFHHGTPWKSGRLRWWTKKLNQNRGLCSCSLPLPATWVGFYFLHSCNRRILVHLFVIYWLFIFIMFLLYLGASENSNSSSRPVPATDDYPWMNEPRPMRVSPSNNVLHCCSSGHPSPPHFIAIHFFFTCRQVFKIIWFVNRQTMFYASMSNRM